MTKPAKISAFTLGEMIVVLIISTIVVGLAFTSLSLIQKQMLSIQTNYDRSMTLNKLETALWLDFNRYNFVEFDNIENELVFSNEIESKTYIFQNEFIIKGKDTFGIKTQYKNLYFQGSATDRGLIDALELETSKEFGNQKLFIFKKNSASAFMK